MQPTTKFDIDDKVSCEILFEKYKKHQQFILNYVQSIRQQLDYYVYNDPELPPFNANFSEISKHIENIENIRDGLTDTLIKEIENYFRIEYNIQFDPLPNNQNEEEKQLTSYHSIIENISNQLGNDFFKAGRSQIKERFQKLFVDENEKPILKGNIISFPSFTSTSETSTKRIHLLDKRKIEILMDALKLYFYITPRKYEFFETQINQWKKAVDYSVNYPLIGFETNVSFKFFKNERVDLNFSFKTSALDFWIMFELQDIAERNRAKNE